MEKTDTIESLDGITRLGGRNACKRRTRSKAWTASRGWEAEIHAKDGRNRKPGRRHEARRQKCMRKAVAIKRPDRFTRLAGSNACERRTRLNGRTGSRGWQAAMQDGCDLKGGVVRPDSRRDKKARKEKHCRSSKFVKEYPSQLSDTDSAIKIEIRLGLDRDKIESSPSWKQNDHNNDSTLTKNKKQKTRKIPPGNNNSIDKGGCLQR